MRKVTTGVAACALALAFAVTSCDEKSSNPATSPGGSNDKGGNLLATCMSPVVFQGIDHCPIGTGSLSASGGNLTVTNLSASDGVQSERAASTFWQRLVDIDFGTTGSAYYENRAISSGVVASTMKMKQTSPNTFDLWADFTGGVNMTYRVELWGGGVLVASQTGLTSSDRLDLTCTMHFKTKEKKGASVSNFGTWVAVMDLFYPRRITEPVNPGACVWELRTPSGTFPNVTLPNSNSYSTIDKIVMIETTAPGAYPYHDFEELETVGTVNTLKISSETMN